MLLLYQPSAVIFFQLRQRIQGELFDTLCHDIFQVVPVPEGQSGTGMLKEGLVSVGSKRSEEADPLSPDIIKRLDNHFRYDEVGDDYYNNEDGDEVHFERILHWYRDYFGCAATTEGSTGASPASSDRSGASILIPIGALRALRRLARGRVAAVALHSKSRRRRRRWRRRRRRSDSDDHRVGVPACVGGAAARCAGPGQDQPPARRRRPRWPDERPH